MGDSKEFIQNQISNKIEDKLKEIMIKETAEMNLKYEAIAKYHALKDGDVL